MTDFVVFNVICWILRMVEETVDGGTTVRLKFSKADCSIFKISVRAW